MFLLVPLFAWLVALAFRRSHYTYLQHLYFALHTHAAWFAAAAVGEAAKLPSPWVIDKGIQALVIGFCVTYTVLAFRRAYGIPTRQAATRTALSKIRRAASSSIIRARRRCSCAILKAA